MSTNSPPPEKNVLRKTTEELSHLAQWIAELIQRRNWFTLLLLIDAALILFFIPGGIVAQVLKNVFQITLPKEYAGLFWFAVAIVFIAAVIVAIGTKPHLSANNNDEFIEPEAIKGLRAFTKDDAEVFSKLQREIILQDCLNWIANTSFRFAILMGETGCGKTSFLQAGLLPKLLLDSATHRGVYVRFANYEPVATVRRALTEQLNLSKEEVKDSDFLELLSQATESTSKPLILIFDQFEQFFVHFNQKQHREAFFKALKQWYSGSLPVKILFTIRSDLYYRMDELQRALGYSPGLNQVFTLEKFSPEEAGKVLEAIAETENLEFDKSFVKELAEKQLANQDGLISPVDLQILSWMIEKQKTSELRAFKRVAFQKLGGIEGLLNRFLQRTLDIITTPAKRQAAVKVLLALTDLERQLRAGVLSLEELQGKLKGDINAAEVQEAVNWLARGDVRLITPLEREGKTTGYELAHEKLIPALTRLTGKELSDADKANKLLDRRVNEWLGNDYSSRYLFNLRELWLIERQKPYLMWGDNRKHKERLLSKSQRRYQAYSAIFTVLLFVMVSVFYWLQTPWGQIQQVRWELESLSKQVSYEYAGKAAIAFAKDGNLKLALKIINDEIEDSRYKAEALTSIAEAYVKLNFFDKAIPLLEGALEAANQIQDSRYKAEALTSIAEASAKLNSSDKAILFLEGALKAVKKTQDSYYEARVLTSIAEAYAKLNSSDKAILFLEGALKAANQTQNSYHEARVLTSIAEVYAKLNSSDKAILFLEGALKAANQIQDSDFKFLALTSIAEAYAKFKSTDKAILLLEKAVETANQIKFLNSKTWALTSIAEAYAKLKLTDKAISILEGALKVAKQIQSSSSKASALTFITETSAKLKSTDKAISLLEKTLEATNQIQLSDSKASALTSIAEAYAKLKSTDKVISLLEKALEATNQIQNSYYEARVLTSIAEVYAKLDNWQLARNVINNCPCPSVDCQVESSAKVLTVWAEKRNPALVELDE